MPPAMSPAVSASRNHTIFFRQGSLPEVFLPGRGAPCLLPHTKNLHSEKYSVVVGIFVDNIDNRCYSEFKEISIIDV